MVSPGLSQGCRHGTTFLVRGALLKRSPLGLGLGAMAFGVEAALAGRTTWFDLFAFFRLDQCGEDEVAQPIKGFLPIERLGAGAIGRQVNFIPGSEPRTGQAAQSRGGLRIKPLDPPHRHPQLHLGLDLVDVLAAGTAASGSGQTRGRWRNAYRRRKIDERRGIHATPRRP